MKIAIELIGIPRIYYNTETGKYTCEVCMDIEGYEEIIKLESKGRT